LHLANSDPFWINAARIIFATVAFKQREQKPTTRNLLEVLFSEDLNNIKELIKNTVAETLTSEKIEKTALSIKATLSTHCKSLLYLPDESKAQQLFSIRNWIRTENDSWLFIATNEDNALAIRSLISAWLDVAVRTVLSLEPSLTRRLWFFMDELPSLYQLPSLKGALARGRKFGVCFTATIQDIHQLRLIYGIELAEALLSLFNTKLCFRTGSPESARWAEQAMGHQEVVEMREGFSYGANDVRDGVTLNQERRKTPVVMDTEFLKLDNLEAYLKLPGNYPIAKVKFAYIERSKIAHTIVARENQNMLLDGSNEVEEKNSPKNEAKQEKIKNKTKVKETIAINNELIEV
jgi:type IV conjugative transfer system coupling protein TraD